MPKYRLVVGDARYRVGNDGSVWSRCKLGHPSLVDDVSEWRRLKPRLSAGYPSVNIRRSTRYVHDLSLTAFVGPRPPGREACHRNNDKTDNRLSNLRWGTHTENYADLGDYHRGEKHPQAKLTATDVREIRQSTLTHKALAKRYGVARTTISSVVRRERWRELTRKI